MKDKIKDILNTYDKAFVPDKILDLPVKGLKVTRGYNQNENAFEVGLVYERPLTVGEALEIFTQTIGSNYLLTELTTKDGGRIVGI